MPLDPPPVEVAQPTPLPLRRQAGRPGDWTPRCPKTASLRPQRHRRCAAAAHRYGNEGWTRRQVEMITICTWPSESTAPLKIDVHGPMAYAKSLNDCFSSSWPGLTRRTTRCRRRNVGHGSLLCHL
jgi:hypothetical protein